MAGTTAKEIVVGIRTKVFGAGQIRSLEAALKRLKKETLDMDAIQRRVTAQYGIQTETLRRSNAVLEAKVNLTDKDVRARAVQKNIEQDHLHNINNRMRVEQDALRFQELATREGITLSDDQARVIARNNMKIVAAENAAAEATRNKARALMQVSISLFVMNISANQLVASLAPLVKENEMATAALKDFQAVLNLTLGPLQAYLALLQITNAMQMQMTQTVGMLGIALGAMMLMFIAIRQESPGIRAALGAISGALIGVTILAYQAALAKTMFAGAVQLAVSSLGGPVGFAIGLAAAGAGLAVMIGYIARAKSAQTRVGQMKSVGRGGLAEIHEGEVISRPGMGTKSAGEVSGGDTIIYLPESYTGTVSQSRFFAQEVQRLKMSGQGTIKMKRVVVS